MRYAELRQPRHDLGPYAIASEYAEPITNYLETTTMTTTTRPLYSIAVEIRREWKNPYYGAVPYLNAMLTLDSVTDSFGLDPGDHVVRYFLANARTWRGDTARRIKAELKSLLGD